MTIKKKPQQGAKPEKFPKLPFEIDIPQLLLHSRQLSLTGRIDEKVVQPIIHQIMALQLISSDPIVMWINSGGGYLPDGFALVDTMRMSKVPIYTVIKGQACSMAAIISIAGHKRLMTENSRWMAHDIYGGAVDYGDKVRARAKLIDDEQKQVFDFWAENTLLTPADLEKARHEELWLTPQECLDKGVVDQIFKTERVKK